MSFRWRTWGNRDDDDDENDDVNIEIIGFSTDLKQTLQNVMTQLDYIIEILQTIESANPESAEYEDAKKFLVPALRGMGITFQELITAVAVTNIDDRQKQRIISIIDETREYIEQVRGGDMSIHGFITKLQELRNTVEKLIEPTETQIQLRSQFNEIISMLEKFRQIKDGGSLLLMMDNFERKWKPVTNLFAEEWSRLDTFTDLTYWDFQKPVNKEAYNRLVESMINKVKSEASRQLS